MLRCTIPIRSQRCKRFFVHCNIIGIRRISGGFRKSRVVARHANREIPMRYVVSQPESGGSERPIFPISHHPQIEAPATRPVQLYSLRTPTASSCRLGLGELGLPYQPRLLDVTSGDTRSAAWRDRRCSDDWRSRAAGDRQTVKLSPQPQLPLAFGFANTNPAAKSSSTQSIVDPTR